MIYQATVKGIAALGGIRPDSHITACPVTAIKAGPVAHYFGRVPCCHRMVVGSDKLAMRQPCLTLTGQRDDTAGAAFLRFVGTGGRRDGRCMSILDSRKPHAEKAGACRARSLFSL
jgi:hypothetical protein